MLKIVLCHDCKHWQKPKEDFMYHGKCFAITHDNGLNATSGGMGGYIAGLDDREKAIEMVEKVKDRMAMTQDYEDYNSELYTRGDFFCALGELKG